MKKIFGIFILLILTGCANTMKPTDFKDQKPRLIIEDYLSGNVKAWGVLQNRSGKVTRQFKADLNGKWDGSQLVLLVPVKGKNIKITFDDWIFMQDERVAINRATMTKFGIKVAELTVMFVKD